MNTSKFYASLRKRNSGVFGTSLSQNQVNGINGILEAFQSHGDGLPDTLAYALATAYHETGKAMVPVKETVMPYHKDKNPSDAEVTRRLDKWAKGIGRTSNIYWRPVAPYGKAYFARGHVGLTWDYNYKGSSAEAGADLLKHPEKMLDPEISARVLFKGLLDGRWNAEGHGLRYYLDKGDLKNARRTVNITDEWSTIAGYHRAFLAAIEAGGGWQQRADPVRPVAPSQEIPAPSGFIAAILAAISAFMNRKAQHELRTNSPNNHPLRGRHRRRR